MICLVNSPRVPSRTARSGDVLKADLRRDAQSVTDVARQVRLVERVEMQVFDTPRQQIVAKLGGQCRGQQVGPAVALGGLEGIGYHLRDRGAAGLGKSACPGPVLNRQNAGNDRRV